MTLKYTLLHTHYDSLFVTAVTSVKYALKHRLLFTTLTTHDIHRIETTVLELLYGRLSGLNLCNQQSHRATASLSTDMNSSTQC